MYIIPTFHQIGKDYHYEYVVPSEKGYSYRLSNIFSLVALNDWAFQIPWVKVNPIKTMCVKKGLKSKSGDG